MKELYYNARQKLYFKEQEIVEGKVLGSGAYGTVSKIMFRGREAVVKRFKRHSGGF